MVKKALKVRDDCWNEKYGAFSRDQIVTDPEQIAALAGGKHFEEIELPAAKAAAKKEE